MSSTTPRPSIVASPGTTTISTLLYELERKQYLAGVPRLKLLLPDASVTPCIEIESEKLSKKEIGRKRLKNLPKIAEKEGLKIFSHAEMIRIIEGITVDELHLIGSGTMHIAHEPISDGKCVGVCLLGGRKTIWINDLDHTIESEDYVIFKA